MLYLPDKDEFMKNYPDTRYGRREANREYRKLEIKQKEAAKARKKTFASQVEQQRQSRSNAGGYGNSGAAGRIMPCSVGVGTSAIFGSGGVMCFHPNTDTVGFPTEQDTMIMFPSQLYHSHPPITIDEERINISWNALVHFEDNVEDTPGAGKYTYRLKFEE